MNKQLNGSVKRNFMSLFSATLAAQLITLLASPLISRLYTPAEFGVYNLYLATIALLIIFVTGRYEFLINIIPNEKESKNVLMLTFLFSSVTSFFILFTIIITKEIFNIELPFKENWILIYLIPLTLFLMGLMQGLNYFLNRNKEFSTLSTSRIIQSGTNNGSIIGFGFLNVGSAGLIVSNIIGLLISIIYIFKIKKINIKFVQENSHIKKLIKIASKNKAYPLFNSFSAFFDMLALQAPAFILSHFFTSTILGLYSMTTRVYGFPITIISNTISQVFLSEIAELQRNEKSYRIVVYKTLMILGVVGIAPFILIFMAGPNLFSLIFGEEWRGAGIIAKYLSIGYYFKFVIAPLAVVFFVNKKIKLLSLIQFGRSITTLIVLTYASLRYDYLTVIFMYSLHEMGFYLVFLYFIIKNSK